MPGTPRNLIDYLRDITSAWKNDSRGDDELMARFVETRDEIVFKVLVCRHGPMVWHTCRRILGDTPDAEDVFQSTFLALTRKAGLFPVKSLAGWLHRVTRQAALNVDANIRRRRSLERQLRNEVQPETKEDVSRNEQRGILDEELAGLPEKLRVPIVLHFLEEKTQSEVARILGCSQSAVQKRLTRGEAILRKRLEQRGLTSSAVTMAALLGNTGGIPAVPVRLLEKTAHAAVAFRYGTLTGVAADGAQKLLRSLTLWGTVQKVWWAMLVCAGTFGVSGVGLVAWWSLTAWQKQEGRSDVPDPTTPVASKVSTQPHVGREDNYGDPLPEGAIARLGTTRFRHEGMLESLFFMPEDKAIVGLSSDAEGLWTWQFPDGKILSTQPGMGYLRCATVSSNGKLMAVGKKDGKIEIWDPVANKRIHQIKMSRDINSKVILRPDAVMIPIALAFLPGDKILASGADVDLYSPIPKDHKELKGRVHQYMHLWDVSTGREILKLENSETSVADCKQTLRGIAFAPNKQIAAMGALNGIIRLWDLKSGKAVGDLQATEVKPSERIQPKVQMVFSADGQKLVTRVIQDHGQGDGWITIWEVSTGKKLLRLKSEGIGSLQLSPDGRTLAAEERGNARLWNALTGESLYTLIGSTGPFAFTSDSKTLLAGKSKAIQMWDVSTGKLLPSSEGHERGVEAVAFSPNGKYLASCGEDAVLLWDTTSKLCRRLDNNLEIQVLTYSPDGKILSGAGYGRVWLWDAVTGKRLHTLESKVENSWCTSLAFSPDRKLIATGWYNKNTVELWQIDTGRLLYSLKGDDFNDRESSSVIFSSDGRKLIWIYGSATTIWDTVSGKQLNIIPKENHLSPSAYDSRWGVSSLDGMIYVSQDRQGKMDKTLRLEEVVSGQERLRISVNSSNVKMIAISPDGRLIASRDPDELVTRLWDATTGKQLHQFMTGHGVRNSVVCNALDFAPDSRTLASGNGDSTILIWDITPWTRKLHTADVPSVELKASCSDLTSNDAAKAYKALWKLVSASDQAVPLLAEQLQPAPEGDPMRMRRLLADLDSDDFQVRNRSREELEKSATAAEPFLRQAVKGNPSLEVRRNIEELLEKLDAKVNGVSLRLLPLLRSVEVLERIGSPAARQALQKVAESPPNPDIGVEASAALSRLERRSIPSVAP